MTTVSLQVIKTGRKWTICAGKSRLTSYPTEQAAREALVSMILGLLGPVRGRDLDNSTANVVEPRRLLAPFASPFS